MRALDVATFGHAENYEQTMASVFSRFSYASATTITGRKKWIYVGSKSIAKLK